MKKNIYIFLPFCFGGAERVGITIGKILEERGHSIKFVIIGNENSEINKMIPIGADKIIINNDYTRWLKMNGLIRKEKPDVVFSPCRAVSRDLIIATKFLKAKTKVIVRSDNPLRTMSPFRQKLIKLTFRFADIAIAQQEEMRQEMINEYPLPAHKVVALQNPIDYKGIEELSKAPTPYNGDDEIRYVWIGRFAESGTKGQDILVRAFNIVHQKNPRTHLYLVGKFNKDGDFYKSIIDYIRVHNLDKYVHIIGFDSNPYRWMKYSDCFVLPSRVEGLPNAMVEAMYLKKPVVATRCLPIIDRMVENGVNGYKVEVEDHVKMAAAMLEALKLIDCRMKYNPASNDEFVKIFEE